MAANSSLVIAVLFNLFWLKSLSDSVDESSLSINELSSSSSPSSASKLKSYVLVVGGIVIIWSSSSSSSWLEKLIVFVIMWCWLAIDVVVTISPVKCELDDKFS